MNARMSIDLSKKAMLVSLKISQWTARKFDRTASREVWDAHSADQLSGRFSKHLAPKCAALDAIRKNANEARAFHYAQTLPWADEGFRLLPSSNYMNYSSEMGKFKNKQESLVDDAVRQMDDMKREAKQSLGTLYNEADYPTSAQMRSLYGFSVTIRPMVVADDFRCQLGEDEVKKIRKQLESEVKETLNESVRDVWDRLYDAVKHLADKLHDPDAIFRDSIIGNIEELVDVLPRLNITDDPTLTSIISEVREKIATREPDALRKDNAARREAEADAAAILAKIAGSGYGESK